MRVLVMAARDPANPRRAGGDITMWEVARHLAARGDQVEYVCAAIPGEVRETVEDGVRVIRLGSLFTTAPKALLWYRRYAASRRPHVVVEEALGGLRVPYIASAYDGVPTVSFWYQTHRRVFEHQFGPRIGWALGLVEKGLMQLHRDSYILTCSVTSRNALIRMGFRSDRISVYYPGPSEELLRLAEQSSSIRREPLILIIGKIRRYKSYHHAIEILYRVRQVVPDAKLVIAGRREDTAYETRMRELARNLGISEAVSIEVDINETRKAELLRAAKVLLIASPVEGFGLTAIEANLFGTPVVASNGVSEEAVLDGVTGYRVPFGDFDRYTAVVSPILSDNGLFTRLSATAAEYARRFSWERAMVPILSTIDTAAKAG